MLEDLGELTQEQIREALHRYVASTDDVVTIVDGEARLLYVNPAAERLFGPREECVGHSAFEFVHPDDREPTRRAFQRWVRDSNRRTFSFENRQRGSSGDVHRMLWVITRHMDTKGEVVFFTSHAHDVTAAREAQRRVLENEVRTRALLRGMLDPVVIIGFDGRVREVSDSIRDVFGWEPEELVGQKVNVLMPEPHRTVHDDYLQKYQDTGETWILNTTREFEVMRKDGAMIECELSVSRIDVPGSGEPLFAGSFREVSERRRAERALAESEARFRAIFDQEVQLVGLLTPDGRVVVVNRTALTLGGVEPADVVDKPFWKTTWWSATERSQERCREAVESAARGEFVRFETEHRGDDGRVTAIDFSLKPVRGTSGEIEYLLPEGRDISSIKHAQQRETAMLKALAAIGESASALAHEIKNPITAINVALRAVADQLGEDQKEVLEDLASRMRKLERTMRRTLAFARPLELRRVVCKARDLLEEARDTMRPHLRDAGVELDIFVDADAGSVSVDRDVLDEVFSNLIRNGIEADARRIRLTAASPEDGFVVFSIEDDGHGVPDSMLATLFKPFVTSREQGTGLGLAISRKIVEEHGGRIEVGKSDLGGARFSIRLPTT